MIETHITHAVDGGLDVFDGVPGQLAIRNLRQLLVEFIIKLEEIIQLLTVNRNPLLMQVLLQQVTLLVVDERCGTPRHRAFNGLANKTAVAHLRE